MKVVCKIGKLDNKGSHFVKRLGQPVADIVYYMVNVG